MEVKHLYLTNHTVFGPDNSVISAIPIDFDKYDALLPFWLPARIFCHLIFEEDPPRTLDIEVRILDPKGKDCGFMGEGEHRNTTFWPLKTSLEVPPNIKELPCLIDTRGPTFNSYGPHSILLTVNGELIATIPFTIKNPHLTE